MDLGLRDRVCVVTGSTGGIGLAAARVLGDEGARVIVAGRDTERVESARVASGAGVTGGCAGVMVAIQTDAGTLFRRGHATR